MTGQHLERDQALPAGVVIRHAQEQDAAALAAFAGREFYVNYAAFNTPENMARYCAEHFTEARQREQIHSPAWRVLLAESNTGLVAFAQMRLSCSPEGEVNSNDCELHRLYVNAEFHGGGLAHRLMDAIKAEALGSGARSLWLGVWQRNAKAIRFYEKIGMRRCGELTFLLGDDRQDDWLMRIDLPDEHAKPVDSIVTSERRSLDA